VRRQKVENCIGVQVVESSPVVEEEVIVDILLHGVEFVNKIVKGIVEEIGKGEENVEAFALEL